VSVTLRQSCHHFLLRSRSAKVEPEMSPRAVNAGALRRREGEGKIWNVKGDATIVSANHLVEFLG
jgi:hypothetical protein